MQNTLNRPSYKETLDQIEEQISHRKEEVKKAEKPYFKAKEKESARRKTYSDDKENDREARKPLIKKLDKTMAAFDEAEAKLEERQEKQKKLLAEDKDYYGERAVHINERLAFRNEKLDKAREKYEKALKRKQESEYNKKLTEKAHQEFQYIKDKVEGWNKQKEKLLSTGPVEYDYEKRAILGEKNHHQIVEGVTQELVDYLDDKGKRQRVPSSRGGPGAHKELPVSELLPMEEVDEDEEIVNRNDPRNIPKPGKESREWIAQHVENEADHTKDRISQPLTEEGFTREIDKVLRSRMPKLGTLHRGEVVKIDQHGNAVLSFYGGDMDGLMYNRGDIGLKVGDQKVFVFKERSKKKGRYIFELAKMKNRAKLRPKDAKIEEETLS